MTSSVRRGLLLLGGVALVVWLGTSIASRVPPAGSAVPEHAGTPEGSDPELRGHDAPTPTVPAATPDEAVADADGVTLVGRVLDGVTYRGRAGIPVSAHCPDRAPIESTTTADGAFRLEFGPRPSTALDAALRVLAEEGRGATAVVSIDPVGPDVENVGTLLLRPTTTLVVRTVHGGKPVADARVYASSRPIRMRPQKGAHFSFSRAGPGFAHEASSDDAGLARLENVATGAVRVLALAPGPLRGELLLSTGGATTPVELTLVEARDLRVEVVEKDTGDPFPGCALVLTVDGRPLHEPGLRPITNAEGVAVAGSLPDDVAIRVVVIGPEWCSAYMRGVSRTAEPGVRALRVEIPAPHTLRFPLVAEDGPHPTDGTRVALEQGPWAFWPGTRIGLAREGVVEGGDLVVGIHGASPERALVRLPDGRVGNLRLALDYDREKRRSKLRLPLHPVVFRAPRTVSVEVTERGTGRPAADVAVRVRLAGGPRVPSLRTDVHGVAVIQGLPVLSGWVSVCANPSWIRPHRHGVFSQRTDIDLEEGGAELQFTVQPIEEGVLKVTTEGRPGFPRGFCVELKLLPEGLSWRTPHDVVFDAARSEVRFRLRPPLAEATPPARIGRHKGTLLARLTSDTHATTYVRLEAGRPLHATVDLVPAGSLLTRVVKPAGMTLSVLLEVQGQDGAWTPAWESPVVPFSGAEEGDLYDGLRPGLYRLHATRLDWTSEHVEVRPGPTPARLVWDLTPVGFAEGEVVLPAGVDPQGLKIFVLEAEGPPRIVAATVELDGTSFRVQVPGDRPVVLKPSHPECEPDAQEGSVTVTRAEKGLRLRMNPRLR